MRACAVLGCNSHSETTTNYTFHRLPYCPVLRARWLIAIGRSVGAVDSRSYVCSRHFDKDKFEERGDTKALVKNAVPTLYLPPKQEHQYTPSLTSLARHLFFKNGYTLQNEIAKMSRKIRTLKEEVRQAKNELQPPMKKRPVKKAERAEMLACRVCLAVDAPLYTIVGSGLEDKFTELTGTPLSAKDGLPRRLCAWCRAQLSKCAEFRARCQRSHSLLQTLLERGPLTINNIKSIDRQSHKLTHKLSRSNLYNVHTNPILEITPLFIKTEDNESNHAVDEVAHYTEVEYLETDDFVENDIKDIDPDYSGEGNEIGKKTANVKVEYEIAPEYLDTGDYLGDQTENYNDINTGAFDQNTKLKRKAAKLEHGNSTETSQSDIGDKEYHFPRKRKRIGDDVYPHFDYNAFELKCKVKIRFLSKEEQRREIEERKRTIKAKFSCNVCGKGYLSEYTLKNHLTYHDPSAGPYECDICQFRFRKKGKMLFHQDVHRMMFTCEECGCVTRTKAAAKNHSLVHSGVTYPCPHCEEEFSHKTTYYSHLRILHPAAHVACAQCGETFVSRRGLRLHRELGHRPNVKHKTEFKCSGCDVTFLSSAALNKHKAVSRGVPHAALWPCAACGDSCGSDAARAQHQAECHPPDHWCQECSQTFASAASFATHVRRKHMNERAPSWRRPPSTLSPPFVCEVCGLVTQTESKLRCHMDHHEKPFACPECPKTFANKYSREYHMRVHTGERPYQCDQCPLAFTSLTNLRRHVEVIHLNRRQSYSCPICPRTLTTASSVKVHVRNVHGGAPQPKRVRTRRKMASTGK